MQAIILAAGYGKRLQPVTYNLPKCMVPVKGIPLLVNTLEWICYSGRINNVLIVIGHMAEFVKSHIGNSYKNIKIDYVCNDLYQSTNNVYSLYLTKDWIHDDCLLLECDLYYRKDLIDTIITGKGDCSILVSKYNRETMDGTAIIAEGNIAKELVIKRHQCGHFDYENAYKTVNIYKFKKNFIVNKFMPAIELYVKTGNLDSYYELVLGSLIYFRNDDIRIVEIDENYWYEIDDVKDLEIAENCNMF